MRLIWAAAMTLAAWGADPHSRFARVTWTEGRVEVEHAGTGERYSAERNQPVGQGFWVETFDGRVELDFDEGSQIRLGPGSLLELSDLTRLSTGQRISLISLERGTLYVTGEPAGSDTLAIVSPGMEASFVAGSRVRVEAGSAGSTLAVREGRVKFSARSVEMELKEGQGARVAGEFELLVPMPEGELDAWSEQRDREAVEREPELDAHGKWIEVAGLGTVWRPERQEGFVPYRAGRWRWYEGLGFTWIGREPWGWLPYRSGRWSVASGQWVWKPGESEIHWMRGPGWVGWGPTREALTFAAYAGGRVVDPARAPQGRVGGQWVTGLPGPEPLAEMPRRKTQVGTTRVVPATAEYTFDARTPPAPPVVVQEVPSVSAPVAVETVRVPEPVYIPVPEVVVVEREVQRPVPPPEPEPQPERSRPRPEVRPAPAPRPVQPAPPTVERSIRLRDPEAADSRARRR